MRTRILSIDEIGSIVLAKQMLERGGLVAFPTDTVYGLGVMAFNPLAIDQLYTVKGRDPSKAIAVLLGDMDALAQVANKIKTTTLLLAERFWPGPLTLIMPQNPALPSNLSPLPTIGVRMPDHKFALALLNQTGPLAVTSANLSGRPNTTTAEEVSEQLKGHINLILDGGKTPGGLPSTVVDCTSDELLILRQGPITRAQLLSALT